MGGHGGRRGRIAEESIRSTAESVRGTPINNDKQFHQTRQIPEQREREIRGKGQGGCVHEIESRNGHNHRDRN